MVVVQTFLLFGDAAIWLLLNTPAPDKVPLVKTLTLSCDIMTAALTALYAYFLAHYVAQKQRVSFAFPRMVAAVCGAMILLWIVCLFNDWYIWYGPDGREHEGPIYGFIQLTNSLLLASDSLFICRHHKTLGRRDTLILSTYGGFPLIGYLLDPYWPITPALLATTLSLVLLYVVTHVQLTRHAMEQELSESRTRIMLSQIQPHFLFNTLASISNLCEKDPMKAQKAIQDFSEYLRGNLDSLKRTAPIPFSRELKHIKIYLSLEKMRFESDLHIVYDIAASGLHWKVSEISLHTHGK